MIKKKLLSSWLVDNWVMIDKWGNQLEGEIPTNSGPAALLVEEVTEALKTVDGDRVAGSVDRSQMWKVSAIVLNRIVVEKLPDEPMDVEALLDVVKANGLAWYVSPISSP